MADPTPAQCVLVHQDARCPNCKRLIGAVGVLRTRRDRQPICKGCWLWLSGQLPVEPGLEEEESPPVPPPPIRVSEEVQAEAAKRRAAARKGAETAKRKAAERKQGGGR